MNVYWERSNKTQLELDHVARRQVHLNCWHQQMCTIEEKVERLLSSWTPSKKLNILLEVWLFFCFNQQSFLNLLSQTIAHWTTVIVQLIETNANVCKEKLIHTHSHYIHVHTLLSHVEIWYRDELVGVLFQFDIETQNHYRSP